LPSIDTAFIPAWAMLAWMVGFRGGLSRGAGNMQIEKFVIGILGKLEHRLEASDSADDPARD
jgi:hypothetical protein